MYNDRMSAPLSKSKPKRRWPQFSLRTFFVLMTAFAVWFGWAMHNAREQRKGVVWVEESGGTFAYDYQIGIDKVGWLRIPDAEPPSPKWVRHILGIDFMDDVVVVDLRETQVSDVTTLAGVKNLERLYLGGTQVSDLPPLAGWKNLEQLSFRDTQVSDLTPLAGLKNLRNLYLRDTPVSEEQVTRLQQTLPDCGIRWPPRLVTPPSDQPL
jgi:hypothetical protein